MNEKEIKQITNIIRDIKGNTNVLRLLLPVIGQESYDYIKPNVDNINKAAEELTSIIIKESNRTELDKIYSRFKGNNIPLSAFHGKCLLEGVELSDVEYVDIYDNLTNANAVIFRINGKNYVAIENPDDGYRSYCEFVKEYEVAPLYRFKNEVIGLNIETDESDDIITFIDANNGKHVLTIGTRRTDAYYPICIFDYEPLNMSCNERVDEEDE